MDKFVHILEPWFSHLQNGSNNNTYVMVPGFSLLTANGGAVVKVTVIITKSIATRTEPLSLVLRQLTSITAQGQPGQLPDS